MDQDQNFAPTPSHDGRITWLIPVGLTISYFYSLCCSLYRRLQGPALPKDVDVFKVFNETKVNVMLEWLVAFVAWVRAHFDALLVPKDRKGVPSSGSIHCKHP